MHSARTRGIVRLLAVAALSLLVTTGANKGACDPEPEEPADYCEDGGFYGDGVCDEGCPQPDPDCDGGGDPPSADPCEENGWYGDGVCDEDCPQPDPDCA